MKLPGTIQKRFALDINALDAIFSFIAEFVNASDINEGVHFQINLVIEELFTNMIKYNQKKSEEVEIYLGLKDNNLIISLIDFNVPPFDITKVEKYDNRQAVGERPIGKVGIHLIRQMMDKVDYRYQDNNNIITLTKHMEKSRV